MAKLQGGTRIYGTANVDSNLYVTSTVNAASFTIGSNFTANTTRVGIGVPILANNAIGTAGQVLTSNSTGGLYWYIGPTGYSGSVGYVGSTGYVGSVGYTGSRGTDGIVGYNGSVGYTGSRGTDGIVGYNGSTGYTGSAAGLSPSNYVVQGKLTSDQSITGGGDVIIQFVDDFDPQNWWNASTYRFTPTIAGYYEVKLAVWWTASSANTGQNNIQARKGGDTFMILQMDRTTVNARSVNGSKLVYLNGSSDYVDFTAYTDVTQSIQYGGSSSGQGSWFSATLLTTGASGYTGSIGIGYTGSSGSGGSGGGFSNGQSIAVANLAFTNSTSSSTGIAYMFVNTVSYSIDTVFV
jgi:hypothetical protein